MHEAGVVVYLLQSLLCPTKFLHGTWHPLATRLLLRGCNLATLLLLQGQLLAYLLPGQAKDLLLWSRRHLASLLPAMRPAQSPTQAGHLLARAGPPTAPSLPLLGLRLQCPFLHPTLQRHQPLPLQCLFLHPTLQHHHPLPLDPLLPQRLRAALSSAGSLHPPRRGHKTGRYRCWGWGSQTTSTPHPSATPT